MNISSKPLSRVKIFIPILIALIAIFNFTPIGKSVQDLYLSINSPLQASFWSRGVSMQADHFKDSDQERTDLLSQISELRTEVEEVDELREALDLELNKEFNLLETRVVGKASEPDHLIISNGSEDGVKEGMPVINSSKSLVGEVVTTIDNFAHVKLISHNETSFDGRVLDKEESLGVIEGGDSLTLEMIDRAADVEEGDMVVTHPGGGIYPGGIFIGEIEEVVREDAEAFQSAVIKPGFNPKDFQILFVITDF
ncbi:MAG: rod shape-determining protein MreC [Patescibacteria group bacterium]